MVMRRSARQSWFSVLAIAFAGVGGAALAGDIPDPVKLGDLVRQDCGSCHGLTMKGGLGKPLTADRLVHWDRDQLTHIILEGVPGTPMPPWRSLLSEAEARWIANELKRGTLQ
jgi:cytochrome c55X